VATGDLLLFGLYRPCPYNFDTSRHVLAMLRQPRVGTASEELRLIADGGMHPYLEWGQLTRQVIFALRNMDLPDEFGGERLATCVFPTSLPDETIYSWCARFHRLNGESDARATSRILFGHSTAGLMSGFPFNLVRFHNVTKGVFGTLANLLILIMGGGGGGLHQSLGLSKAGVSAINPLKFCPGCRDEQLRQHSHAWWVDSHQQPPSFACQIHRQWLRVADASLRTGLLNEYCLPEVVNSQSIAKGLNRRLASCGQLTRLAAWGAYLRRQRGNLWLSDEALCHCYRHEAKNQGWVARDGGVRILALRDAFIAYHGDVLQLFPRGFLGDLAGFTGGFLGTLLKKSPSHHYPMKHLLLLSFLFETPNEFMAVREQVKLMLLNEGDRTVQSSPRKGQRC
jgi:hypothetical protein